MIRCPYCGSNLVITVTNQQTVRFASKRRTVSDLESCECCNCLSQFVSPEQHDANLEKIVTARTEMGGGSARELRTLRASLNLTIDEAERLLGCPPGMLARYESGKSLPGQELVRLLRLSVEVPGVLTWLKAHRRRDK